VVGRVRDTFLFDLDGTLLPLDMDDFLKQYYIGIEKRGVTEAISKTHGNEYFEKAVFAMIGNDGSKSNKQAFFDSLSAMSGIDEEKLFKLMDEFYVNEFLDIKGCTEVEERAIEIIRMVKNKGYRLVLATNPLFPPVATNQRIEWGGLNKDDFEYVTYYDNSSFCKPSKGYYEEILTKLGLSAEQCYIVGNDVRDDMSAVSLGLKGFLVTDHLLGDIREVPKVCEVGDYSALLDFVNALPKI